MRRAFVHPTVTSSLELEQLASHCNAIGDKSVCTLAQLNDPTFQPPGFLSVLNVQVVFVGKRSSSSHYALQSVVLSDGVCDMPLVCHLAHRVCDTVSVCEPALVLGSMLSVYCLDTEAFNNRKWCRTATTVRRRLVQTGISRFVPQPWSYLSSVLPALDQPPAVRPLLKRLFCLEHLLRAQGLYHQSSVRLRPPARTGARRAPVDLLLAMPPDLWRLVLGYCNYVDQLMLSRSCRWMREHIRARMVACEPLLQEEYRYWQPLAINVVMARVLDLCMLCLRPSDTLSQTWGARHAPARICTRCGHLDVCETTRKLPIKLEPQRDQLDRQSMRTSMQEKVDMRNALNQAAGIHHVGMTVVRVQDLGPWFFKRELEQAAATLPACKKPRNKHLAHL